MNSQPDLSLCMIVRNEERWLANCLASASPAVDEIVVADTGSTDATLAIARSFGAKTCSIAWKDDFAKARNESLRQVNGRWVLYLDADERLAPSSVAGIKALVSKADPCYVSALVHNLAADGSMAHLTRAHRLFPNLPGLQFTGAVHESVAPFFQEKGIAEYQSDIVIEHRGYALPEEEMRSKERRNYRLLRKQIEREPENPITHYFLAQNLILSRSYRPALAALQRALEIGGLPADIRLSSYNNLAEVFFHLGDYTRAIDFAHQALNENPAQMMAHLLLYKIYRTLQSVPDQIVCLENALRVLNSTPPSPGLSIEASVRPALLYMTLGRLYAALAEHDKARVSFEHALVAEPDNGHALAGLAEAHIVLENTAAARETLEKATGASDSDFSSLERIAVLALKCGAEATALSCLTRLEERWPENLQIKRRLAGLHHKMGNEKEARAYLAIMRRPA